MPIKTTIVPDFSVVDMSDMGLPMIVVYRHPIDFPDKFVARLHESMPPRAGPTNIVVIGDTLDEIRAKIPQGMVCMQRHQNDDVNIVEVWI